MINKAAVDRLKEQIKGLESIRDQLLAGGPAGNLGPIFDKINELYEQLLKELGYITKSDGDEGVGD